MYVELLVLARQVLTQSFDETINQSLYFTAATSFTCNDMLLKCRISIFLSKRRVPVITIAGISDLCLMKNTQCTLVWSSTTVY